MGKTSALWLKEVWEQLPWFLALTLFNKIEMAWGLPMASSGMLSSDGVAHTAMLSGRWTDDWPITFVFYGALFGLWGYFSFYRHRMVKADNWFRTMPVSETLPAAIRLGTGLVLVALVFLIDLLSTFAILDAVGHFEKLNPNFKSVFFLGKGLMVFIYGAWYLAGCWVAQWQLRWRRWYPLLLAGLVALVFLGNVLLMAIAASSESLALMRIIDRYQIATLVVHVVAAVLFSVLVLRSQKNWEVV